MKQHTLFRKCSVLVACLFAVMLVAGCTGEDKNRIDRSYDEWKAKAEDSMGYSPSVRRRIMLDDRDTESADNGVPVADPEEQTEKLLPDSPVSLNMSDVAVAVLLRSLARAAGQNIMINEKVGGRANINIRKAPWDQVFLAVLKTHGLSYQWEGDIIRIMTAADVARDLQQAAQKIDLRELEPLATRIIRVDYAEAANLKKTLDAFLTRSKKGTVIGSIMVDTHTNTLIVQALKDDLADMLPLVEQLDRPTPQVLIEAYIVEASADTGRELGIQWGGKYQFNDKNNTYTFGGDGTTAGSGVGNTSFSFPTNTAGVAGMTLGFLLDSGGENVLNAQLSALEEERKLKILSSPSITTIDNQRAIFESGEEVPYQSVDDGNVKIEFKRAVLKLEVTPHVIDGEALKLIIKVNKDQVDRTVNPPSIITKNAETNVILYDGQTTVIGGLNSASDGRADSGVPGLRNLPFLGVFFRGEQTATEMEDVLIFITPHILKQRIGAPGSKAKDQP